MNVFSTHLDYYSTSYRTTQLQQLMTWALNFGGPRLVGGDFNSWWGENWITTMMTQNTDTWQDYTGSNQNGTPSTTPCGSITSSARWTGGWRATPTNCLRAGHRCRITTRWLPTSACSNHPTPEEAVQKKPVQKHCRPLPT